MSAERWHTRGEGLSIGHNAGFVIDCPAVVFHLSSGCNCLAVRQVGSPTKYQDHITFVGASSPTASDKGQVTNGVVTHAGKVGVFVVRVHDSKVTASHGTISSTVNESAVEASRIVANIVGRHNSMAFVCGRRLPRGKACHPAFMFLGWPRLVGNRD